MMVECAKLVARDASRSRRSTPYRGAPIFPARDDLADAELVDFIRAKAETIYHPVGTCRMGSDDASRWSIRSCACAASKACAWSMPR